MNNLAQTVSGRMTLLRVLGMLLLLTLLASAPGCAAIVGDSCETQSDCGQGMFCEKSLPDGYCTIRSCVESGCPEEAVCIRFDNDTSYCMAHCGGDGDCRGGYRCVKDFGLYPFCNDASGETPTE